MVQVGNDLNYPTEEDSINGRLTMPVGSRAYGQLVQVSRANQPLPMIGTLQSIRVPIPGIGAAAAYALDDQMGTAFSFVAPSCGIIREVRFHDLDDEGIDKEIWLFEDSPTLAADNAAFSIADADNLRVIAVFLIGTWRDAVNNQVGLTMNTPAAYNLGEQQTIFGAVKTKGADNIAADALPQLSFVIEPYRRI